MVQGEKQGSIRPPFFLKKMNKTAVGSQAFLLYIAILKANGNNRYGVLTRRNPSPFPPNLGP